MNAQIATGRYDALLRVARPNVTSVMQGSRLAEGLPMPCTALTAGAGKNGEDTLLPLGLAKMTYGESFRIDPVQIPDADKHRVVLLGAKRRDNTRSPKQRQVEAFSTSRLVRSDHWHMALGEPAGRSLG